MLEEQLKTQISPATDFLNQFDRAIISDSSRFDVPENFKDKLPGFSGKASSKAGVSIQFSFDIKVGEVLDLSVVPAVTSDSKYVSERRESVHKGDIYIRDLGYYSTDLLSFIDQKEAFYCSRLNSKVNVYQKKDGQYELLSFKKLYLQMKRRKLTQIELDVYIGQKEKMHTRLIVDLMPEEIYANRTRKLKYYNKHNGHRTSEEQKNRMKFNLFITNVPSSALPPNKVYLLYKIRWQIELRLKILKSTFSLDKLHKMKYERYLTMLYAKLLIVFIFYEMIINIESASAAQNRRKLSLDKCFKTMKRNSLDFIKVLLKKQETIKIEIEEICGILSNGHWLESKKNRAGLIEIYEVFI